MKISKPPRLAQLLFDWYCRQAKVEDLKGDIDELFEKNIKSHSASYAKRKYWKQVISLITSYAIRKRKRDARSSSYSSNSLSFSMLKNYLIVAARTLYKHKYFSIVNAVGLAIGMSIGLLWISLYSHVSSFDDFHSKKENIYRVISTRKEGVEIEELASVPDVLAKKLSEEYTGIKEVVRINSTFSGEVVLDKENLLLRGYYADPSFLRVFDFKLQQGSIVNALTKPNSIVLNGEVAKKIFGNADALGQTLEVKGLGNFEVTGILKDPPLNTHFRFEALVSYNTLPVAARGEGNDFDEWTNYRSQYVYLLLPDQSKVNELQYSLNKISDEIYSQSKDVKADFQLQSLTEITPGPDLRNSIGPQWDYSGFIIFGTLTLLILLPACFNYTNISIARALKRSKEIGLRKTMGGLKGHIFFQFITETVVITMLSLVGALFIFLIVRSEFQSMLVDASLLDLSLTPKMISLFILFAVTTGFLAGFSPALYFAGLNPIQALKNQGTSKILSGMRIRKGLTIFQFALTFCFILSLIVFSRQYRHSLNYDFGFQKENILDVELQGVNSFNFKTEFSKLSSVQNVSFSSGIMGLNYSETWIHSTDNKDSIEVAQQFVDDEYIANTKLKLVAGQSFPDKEWKQEEFIIVNEEFLKARQINTPTDAIGKIVSVDNKELEIIGVLKNFHFASLQLPIKPFFFRMNPGQFAYANMKVAFKDTHTDFRELENVWSSLSDRKLKAKFFDDEIDEAYDFYQSLLKIIGFMGLLAISISLLGLLGMVVYSSEGKTKEVGIRKVMGATTTSIAILFSKDYLKLMLWAMAVAIPLTVLLFDNFLSTIQYYSVKLSFWDVLLSMVTLLFLGLATIASQTYKTASTNPAETLKYE